MIGVWVENTTHICIVLNSNKILQSVLRTENSLTFVSSLFFMLKPVDIFERINVLI